MADEEEEEEEEEEGEKTGYYSQLIYLIVDLGTEGLSKIFKKHLPAGLTVETFLRSKATEINRLKRQNYINDLQLKLINAQRPDESQFDISLWFTLLRNLTGIQPPNTGWDSHPAPSDKSLGASLLKLKNIRNEVVGHKSTTKLKKAEFQKLWTETENCLIDIADAISPEEKNEMKQKIEDIRAKRRLRDDNYKLNVLLKWYLEEKISELLVGRDKFNSRTGQLTRDLSDVKEEIVLLKRDADVAKGDINMAKGDVTSIKSSVQEIQNRVKELSTEMLVRLDRLNMKVDEQDEMSTEFGLVTQSFREICEHLEKTSNVLSPCEEYERVPGKGISFTEHPDIIKHMERLQVLLQKCLQNTASTAPIITEPVKRLREDEDRDTDYENRKKELKEELLEHYRENNYFKPAVRALVPDYRVEIDDLFVMPEIEIVTHRSSQSAEINNDGGTKRKTVSTLKELFHRNGEPIRTVYLSGEAGHGKTTLCQKMVSFWCTIQGKSSKDTTNNTDQDFLKCFGFLKSFDFLFYLPLRHYNKAYDVVEMIKEGIVREGLHNQLSEILRKESKSCFIILDGLDEWVSPADRSTKLPYIDQRERFSVLITSRPWKLEVLRSQIADKGQEAKLSEIDLIRLGNAIVDCLNRSCGGKKYFDVLSMTKELCSTLLSPLPLSKTRLDYSKVGYRSSGGKEESEIFMESKHYSKVESLIRIPVILTQILCMWYDNENFGTKRIEIYSGMVEYLINVALKRHPELLNFHKLHPETSIQHDQSVSFKFTHTVTGSEDVPFNFKDLKLCRISIHILLKLSNLAYHTLFSKNKEESLVFPHSITKLHKLTEKDVEFFLTVGLLSMAKYTENKVASQYKKLSFLHKTFQEFFAAVFIAFGGDETLCSRVLQRLKSLEDVFEMSQVLIFLSGLKPELVEAICICIAELSEKDERIGKYRGTIVDIDNVGSWIWRINRIVCDCLNEGYGVGSGDIRTVEVPDLSGKLVKISCKNIKNLKSYVSYYFSDESCDWIHLERPINLVKLDLEIKTEDHIDRFVNIMDMCKSTLNCVGVEGHSELDGTKILESLQRISHLTCLKLSGIKVAHRALVLLLCEKTELKELILNSVECSTCEHETCCYKIDLSNHIYLKSLHIHTSIGAFPVGISSRLEDLEIGGLDDGGYPSYSLVVNELTRMVPMCKDLMYLSLFYVDFEEEIMRLSPDMTSLKRVWLCDCKMTNLCSQCFIDSLPQTDHELCVIIYHLDIKPDKDKALDYIRKSCRTRTNTIVML